MAYPTLSFPTPRPPVFQTHQQAVHILGASHQSGEGSQLFRQGQEDLVLIIDGICGTKTDALQCHPKADLSP